MTNFPANLNVTRLDEQPALVGTPKQIACAIWMRKEVLLIIWKFFADAEGVEAQALYDEMTKSTSAAYWMNIFFRLKRNNYGWVEIPGAFTKWLLETDRKMQNA
jgi:hypothetical protein